MIIINFEGVIGDLLFPNIFMENCMLKYIIRPEIESGMKLLKAKYNVIIVRKMENLRFKKFYEYFHKRGIEFDGIYINGKKNTELILTDYDIITKDFPHCDRITILESYDIDPDWINKSLKNSFVNKCISNKNITIVLVPHIKLFEYIFVTMEDISKFIILLNQKMSDTKSSLETQCAITKKSKYKFIFLEGTILKDKFQAICMRELELYNRWLELRNKKKVQIETTEIDKNRAVKNEMISSLMSSNVEAHNCIHLANQYFKIVESVYGKISEAAIAEIKSKEILYYNETIKPKSTTAINNKLYLIMNSGNIRRNVEVISIEKYIPVYINLNGFFSKKAK